MGNQSNRRWLLAATALSVAAGWSLVGLGSAIDRGPASGNLITGASACAACSMGDAAALAPLFEDFAQADLRKFLRTMQANVGGPDPDKLQFRSATTPDGSTFAVCFAPGTPLWKISQFMASMTSVGEGAWPYLGSLRPTYYTGTRWPGTVGTPVNLTWSFVPDGLSIPGYNPGLGEAASASVLFATLDSQFSGQGGRATWINRFQQIFDRWHHLAGVNYTRVTNGGNDWDDGAAFDSASGAAGLRGDVRIGMHPIDGPNGVLAYNFFPGTGRGGNMVIDNSQNWADPTDSHRFLRNTLGHEHGHGLALEHVCPTNETKLMEPFLSTDYDGPRHDDIRGIQALYGDAFEPNDTAAVATNLGAVSNGGTVIDFWKASAPITGTSDANTSRCSIEGSGKVDYYKFTIASPQSLTFSVSPIGLNYDDSTQDQFSGACNAGHFTNSLAIADLNFDVISTDGTTILSTSATSAAGQTESKSGIALPSAGTYFIKVYAGNAPTQSQMYSFSLSLSNPVPAVTSLNPTQANAGGAAFTLTVNGSNFLPNSVVRWNGSDRSTTFVSSAQLTASISAADIATAGSATVTVFNPTPGGGLSNGVTFTINSATVTVPPASVSTTRGAVQAGSIGDLATSNDVFMAWRPGPVLSAAESPVDVTLTAASPTATPSQIQFVFEARVTTQNIGQRLWLFNYVTSAWEEIDFRGATSTDNVVTVTISTNASRFVNAATLAIRARFAYKPTGPLLSFPWNARIDQSVWRITP